MAGGAMKGLAGLLYQAPGLALCLSLRRLTLSTQAALKVTLTDSVSPPSCTLSLPPITLPVSESLVLRPRPPHMMRLIAPGRGECHCDDRPKGSRIGRRIDDHDSIAAVRPWPVGHGSRTAAALSVGLRGG